MTLRSAALSLFAQLDMHWSDQLELFKTCTTGPTTLEGELDDAFQAKLAGAAIQFNSALVQARASPLSNCSMGSLQAARDILNMVWIQHAESVQAPNALPGLMRAQWVRISLETAQTNEGFNQAVAQYNAAIAQPPASLVAWLFSLQPARTL
ncbi:MAG: hypothetical protein ACKVOO_06320 [Burkholderiaceae bacterium]